MTYLSIYSFGLFILVIFLLTSITLNSQVYDVQHYDIQIDLYHSLTEEDAYYTGDVQIILRIDTIQTNQVNFDSFGLQIDSVKVDSANIVFSVNPNILAVNLDRIYYQDEEVTVNIFFAHPDSLGAYYGGYVLALPSEFLSQKVAYTWGLPNYSHYWFPCNDDPSDKASLDITVAVPEPDYIVASNGELVDLYSIGNKKYFHWRDVNPMKTAIVFFAASKYTVLTESFLLNNELKELQLYVWPVSGGLNFDPNISFSKIKDIIEFCSDIYMQYPFENLKFAFAQGFYSNQTIINIDELALKNLNVDPLDYIFPHEIAHQWFGSYINAGSLRELWLNEGFAEYSSLLFTNHKFGYNQFRNSLNYNASIVLLHDISLVNDSLYNPYIYFKGPCVIDMLRFCMGDSLYWASISLLLQEYSLKSFISADLLNVVQTVTGEDYNWFFDQWVYNAGFPIYEIEYRKEHLISNDYQVNIQVKQTQSTPNYFKMPLPFRIISSLTDTTVTLINDSWDQSFSIVVQGNPDSIKFDQENRVLLKKISSITGVISELQNPLSDFVLYQNYPNPFNPTTKIRFTLSASSSVKINVYNTLGQLVETLVDKEMDSGYHEVNFNASKLASGIYLYQLQAGDFISSKKMILIK